jgi:hypothetical protein
MGRHAALHSWVRCPPTSKEGLGCNIPSAAERAEGKPVPDLHSNEHATCYHLRDRGLIVISSCRHSGIVNTTRQAMKVAGLDKVHAILGGFHLFPANEDYLSQTVAELKANNPDVLIPMHCSGPGLIASLRNSMPDQLVRSTTGTEYVFGAWGRFIAVCAEGAMAEAPLRCVHGCRSRGPRLWTAEAGCSSGRAATGRRGAPDERFDERPRQHRRPVFAHRPAGAAIRYGAVARQDRSALFRVRVLP